MKWWLLGAAVVWSTLLRAQNAKEEVLDNADVIALFRLGLSKEIVKAKIQNEKTNFNLSGDSLAGLKKAGVGDDVILVMMARSGSVSKSMVSAKPPTDKEPALAPGWYIRNGAGFDRLEPNMLTVAPAKGLWGTLKKGLGVLVPFSIHAELAGDSAKRGVKASSTLILVIDSFPAPSEPKSPAEFLLVQLDRTGRNRTVNFERPLVPMNQPKTDPNIKISGARTIPFASRRLNNGMYEIKCPGPLPPGSYCLMIARSSYYTGHAFAVVDFDTQTK